MLEGLTIYGSHVSAVFATLRKQPWFCLKVVSVFKAEDPLYLQLLTLLLAIILVYYRQQKYESLSAIDQLWSILPTIYITLFNLHYFMTRGQIHGRLLLLWLLIVVWSIRLTYNLYIKGGYIPRYEDYRWQQLRGTFFSKALNWFALRFGVAVVYLPLTNWLQLALPAYVIYRGDPSLYPADFALALIHLFFLGLETVADYQMYTFQQMKKVRLRSRDFSSIAGDVFTHGYMQEGLYKYSRHPNYFGEAGQWLTIFLFSCVNAGFNWSFLGFLNFSVMLYNSLYLTEFYTNSKYPKWKHYAGQLNPIFLRPPDLNAKPIRIDVVAAKDM